VTSNGENVPMVLYLPPAAVDRPYTYDFIDEELFSRIIYPITYYQLSGAPSWLTLNGREISGTPTGYPSTQTFPIDLIFILIAYDVTWGNTQISVSIQVTN
jgi:hypothetical protein